ncbi:MULTISPECIES: nuclear transport factor 2 family protein [unclassified Streptomyces]|uniref:nuclear transport factor 2 family protein n=1 Tax=unclassified Streptomyces TaxID=2593676 RepID=UPI0004C9480C|nr:MULTISPECIES: nuclear transport factor 2 family protein [unclassified Streptomyces]QHF97849.1 nuclear transport factor 2 family protein [Streptomyces sp. NHF165]
MPSAPTPPTDPAALFRHSLRLLLDKDIPGWVALWDEDGIMEFPFAAEGLPRRLDGREAVAAYMRDYPDHIDLHDFPRVEIHRTTDPRVLVVEMRSAGRIVATGAPFQMDYVAVVTVEDGRFTRYRDYWSPATAPEGSLDFAGDAR